MSAIAFPRDIPDNLLVAGLTFQFEEMVELAPSRGGDTVSADIGPPVWRARYESGILDEAEFGECRAFCDTLMSSQKFYGYDHLREYPLAYKDGWGPLMVDSSPFTGTCKIKTVASSKLVTLKELPAPGFTLSKGDYIAFDYGANGARALHRISNGGQTDSSGEVVIEVRPLVRVGWALNDVVSLYRPAALMCRVPGSYTERIMGGRLGSVSFDAVQVKP